MKVLDLFSGIGGFSLGLERAGMETIAFCEIDPFCRKVLKKHWPDVPIHDDIRNLDGKQFKGTVDVVCGGYPCQPFSTAGERRGEEDDRHLWPEYLRLIREISPSWVIGENVSGHISMGLDQVLSDLEGEGYSWEAFVIPACSLNALHRRDRVWIVANSIGIGQQGQGLPINSCNQEEDGEGETSDAFDVRIGEEWAVEPGMGRVANGVPHRVDRLRGLGNAVVPQIPEIIGRAIMEINTP